MLVNRKELARRIAYRKGYNIGDVEELLKDYEDVVVDAIDNGDTVKHGKLYKTYLKYYPEKSAWNGLHKKYYTKPATERVKFEPLVKLNAITKILGDEEEDEKEE